MSICAVPPLIETYKDASFFPIPPSRDSIESVDMALHIPVAIDFFYDYLKERHNPDGIHAFALYIDLRIYDGLCLNNTETSELDEGVTQGGEDATDRREEIIMMAQKIKQEYLDEDGDYFVELEPQLRNSFLEKYAVVEELLDTNGSLGEAGVAADEDEDERNFDLIFIEVYAFVLEKLRSYFEQFKRSNAFTELENEIGKKERLYEILIDANLISN